MILVLEALAKIALSILILRSFSSESQASLIIFCFMDPAHCISYALAVVLDQIPTGGVGCGMTNGKPIPPYIFDLDWYVFIFIAFKAHC